MMNRRSFIKGTGLGAILWPLLPRLAEGRGPGLIGQPRVDYMGNEWAACVGISYNQGRKASFNTEVDYQGTPGAIRKLNDLVLRQLHESVFVATLSPGVEVERFDSWGRLECIMQFAPWRLSVQLHGLWLVEMGPVESGQTNIKRLG